jgi:hypothetical protein
MPRVLMPRETDATTTAEKQEAFAMVRQAMEEIMTRHNTAFLNSFRQMMVGVGHTPRVPMQGRMKTDSY